MMLVLSLLSLLSMAMATMTCMHNRPCSVVFDRGMITKRETQSTAGSPPHRPFHLLAVVCGRRAAAATSEGLHLLKVPLVAIVPAD